MIEYEKDRETEKIPMLRYYRVFQIDDIEGINPEKIPENRSHDHDFDPIGSCDQLVEFWSDSPKIRLGKNKACYIPSIDEVNMPSPRTFFDDVQYYSTLFLELVHSTGHRKRLNRHDKYSNHNFRSNSYSKDYPNSNIIPTFGINGFYHEFE